MKKMTKLFKHLTIVHNHRRYVREWCFKMGIPIQGMLHDLSKYSLTELSICKYYSGTKSPHQNCREILGYSPSWNHHKRLNKHHWQYWLDDDEDGKFIGIKMPYKYVIEMFCDMVGAGKAYQKKAWTCESPWNYYIQHCVGKRIMHNDSEYLLKKLFWNLKTFDEKEFLNWYNSKNTRKYLKLNYLQGIDNY